MDIVDLPSSALDSGLDVLLGPSALGDLDDLGELSWLLGRTRCGPVGRGAPEVADCGAIAPAACLGCAAPPR